MSPRLTSPKAQDTAKWRSRAPRGMGHGQTGRPEGMPHQTWNAAMFLLAAHGLSRSPFAAINRRSRSPLTPPREPSRHG